jgi:hypothetical protein
MKTCVVFDDVQGSTSVAGSMEKVRPLFTGIARAERLAWAMPGATFRRLQQTLFLSDYFSWTFKIEVDHISTTLSTTKPAAPETQRSIYGLLLGLQAHRPLAMRYDCSRISGL